MDTSMNSQKSNSKSIHIVCSLDNTLIISVQTVVLAEYSLDDIMN